MLWTAFTKQVRENRNVTVVEDLPSDRGRCRGTTDRTTDQTHLRVKTSLDDVVTGVDCTCLEGERVQGNMCLVIPVSSAVIPHVQGPPGSIPGGSDPFDHTVLGVF